jgi:uncharacterized membrane protein
MAIVLLGCILGSRLNIPMARFTDRRAVQNLYVLALGVVYRIPVMRRTRGNVLAINVGGALIPAGLACYLTIHDDIWAPALAATAMVAAVVWLAARPVPGVGIVTPALLPPVAAAVAATLLTGSAVAAVAYVCGTMGTLVGADLLHLPRIRELGGPVVSIGGAGTFDGIFLTGVLAVLIAG